MLAILKNKKMRPFVIGGIVLVGGAVLFFTMRRSGGGSETVVMGSSGPSEQAQLGLAQIAAGSQANQLAANVEMARIATEGENYRYGADAQLDLASLQAQTAQYVAGVQGQVQLAGVNAQRDVAIAGEVTAQRGIDAQVMLGQTSADVEKARIQSQTQMAQIQGSVAKKQSSNNLVGSILTAGLAFFSDQRMKKEITWTGENLAKRPAGRGFDEYGAYSWEWKGAAGLGGTGVIAQDYARAVPHGVVLDRGRGRYRADYAGMPA